MSRRLAVLTANAAPMRPTLRALLAACLAFAACQGKPPAPPPKPERPAITAHDPGYQILAQVANARWALAHGARVFAENELQRATQDAGRLPDETTAVFASTANAGGGGRSGAQTATGAPMTSFDLMVRLQSAKEDVDAGDLAGAEEDLATLATAAPPAPATAELPLLQAGEALKLAAGDAANRVVTDLEAEVACAEQSLSAYGGQARRGDARALAAEIARRLAGAGGAESIDRVQLEIWSARIATWI